MPPPTMTGVADRPATNPRPSNPSGTFVHPEHPPEGHTAAVEAVPDQTAPPKEVMLPRNVGKNGAPAPSLSDDLQDPNLPRIFITPLFRSPHLTTRF